MLNSFRKIFLLVSIALVSSTAWSQSEVAGDSTKTNPYEELDMYAREAPENVSKSPSQLAKYLEKKATNDLEKTRLIFTWIATHIDYDSKAYSSGKYPDQTAENVLTKRMAVCSGFSSLFGELAKLMGLKSERISGYAKGYGYKNGHIISKVNHDWNAVKINGSWRLIDVTWGEGYIEGAKAGLISTKRFDNYWFMPAPEEFRFSHLPVDDKWQLVRPRISLSDFNKLPLITSDMFKVGFNDPEILTSILKSGSGQLVKLYKPLFKTRVKTLPLFNPLVAGKEYKFVFETSQIKNLSFAFVENGESTWLKREGNVFSGVVSPKTKALIIVYSFNPKQGSHTFLEYNVVNKK